MNTSDLKSFNYLENGEVTFSILDTIKSVTKLDSGCYFLSRSEYPDNRIILNINNDIENVRIHDFSDKEKLDKLFNVFLKEEIHKKINDLGFNHKVGIILHGREGTGKSTILKYYYNRAIKENKSLVFYMNCTDRYIKECWNFIMNIRKIQKNPIIVIFEEIDGQVDNGNEPFLKTVLDGNMSIDNVLFFATTNHLEKIPEALKNRPSRFKYVLNIEGIQNADDVYIIIEKMLKNLFTNGEIMKFSEEIKGQSLDFIKQFCMDKLMDIKTYQHKRNKKLGF